MTKPQPLSARPRCRGVASVMAIAMIAMMSIAMTALMWRIKDRAIDFRGARREAQLRQMLIAGATASTRVVHEKLEHIDLAPPKALADQGGTITLTLVPSPRDVERLVRVEARLRGARAVQVVR